MASESSVEISLREDALLGRNLAARRVFASHYKSLLRFLHGKLGSRDEASDLAQEAYLRLCRQRDLAKFQGKERSYLFKVATNLLRDRYRRHATRNDSQPFLSANPIGRTTTDETPQQRLEYKQTLAKVKKALLTMDPEWRQVFMMRRFQRTPYRQIAEQLGLSERTVERHMHRALNLLKRELMSQPPLTPGRSSCRRTQDPDRRERLFSTGWPDVGNPRRSDATVC